MTNTRGVVSCLGLLLLAGCASDGERAAPIEAREVRRQVATVSGNSTRAATAGTEIGVKPTSPDAPKVMALPDADRAASGPVALPVPAPIPMPGPDASTPPPATPTAAAPVAPTGSESSSIAADAAPQPSAALAAPAAEPAGPAEPARKQAPAVRQLLQEAEAARQAADFVRARAVLERGVKLAPREPELWYRLAEVAYAERDWEQCQTLAQRASSLARDAPDLRARAEALAQAAVAKGASRAGR